MNAIAITVLILGILLILGGLAPLCYYMRRFVKDAAIQAIGKKRWLFAALFGFLISLGFALLILALFEAHPAWKEITAWSVGPLKGQTVQYSSSLTLALAGSFAWAYANVVLWSSFTVRFYKPTLLENDMKSVKILLYGFIPVVLFALLLFLEGLAPYLPYPLYNAIVIGGEGGAVALSQPIGFEGYVSGGLHLSFYAICILLGVAVAYFVSDHLFYQKYHKHGILDLLVLVAFPAGVIGARIWYVVGNWDREFAGYSWTKAFEIWNGGLTILGGAAAGVLVGYLFLRATKKFVDMRFAIDAIVPTVLLAQALGRFGNFFNVEVYGQAVDATQGVWSYLPSWLLTNMSFQNGGGSLSNGQINVPLFLVEAVLNVLGYFLIAYGIGKGLKKYHSSGALCGAYFLWYGIVRVIMEPMRNADFNMGTDNAWSICNSIAYILIGLGIIALFHLYDGYKKNGKTLHFPIIGLSLLGISLFLPFLPSISVSAAKDGTGVQDVYTGFEVIFGGSPYYLVVYTLVIAAFISFAIWLALLLIKKEGKALGAVGVSSLALSLLAGVLYFFGKGTVDVPSSSSDPYVNLSYGFVIAALLSLLAGLLGGLPYLVALPGKIKGLKARKAPEGEKHE